MSEREEGFYWIRTHENGDWEAAQYWAGSWYLCGSDVGAEESPDSWFPIVIHDLRRINPPPT